MTKPLKTIHKVTLSEFNDQPIMIPREAFRVLHVDNQNDSICIWYETLRLPQGPMASYKFHVVGTGHNIPERTEYHGTLQDGPLVWHIYGQFV